MERPLMNPLFMDGAPPPQARKSLLRRVWSVIRWTASLLLLDVRFWKRSRLEVEDGAPWQILLRGMVYRLLFLPVLVCLIVAGLVYQGTHPPAQEPGGDPVGIGTHFEPVSFAAQDGTRLEGWLVPVLDAKTVIEKKEKVLRNKQPGIVLVHDQAGTRAQMLPLVRPFHEAGYIVLVSGLRASSAERPISTFGLLEAADVRAAVEVLRRRTDVDGERICVLGVGTGANAAMLAVANGTPVKALVLDRPVRDPRQLVSDHLALPQPWLRWMHPGFRWTFELAYRVDIEDIDPRRHEKMLQNKPVLVFDAGTAASNVFRTRGLEQTRQFLAKHLAETTDVARTE